MTEFIKEAIKRKFIVTFSELKGYENTIRIIVVHRFGHVQEMAVTFEAIQDCEPKVIDEMLFSHFKRLLEKND